MNRDVTVRSLERQREGQSLNKTTMRVEQKTATKNSIVRLVFVLILIALQFTWIYFLITSLESRIPWLSTVITFGAFILALTISARHLNASYRIFWVIMVLSFPVLGIPFYAVMGRKNSTRRMRMRLDRVDGILFRHLTQQEEVLKRLSESDRRAAQASNYLLRTCNFPVYGNTDVQYFPDAADCFESQLADLEKAEKFIFLEYYAIEENGAFERALEILKRKAAEGVEIRVTFDDIGSITFLNNRFVHRLESCGIHCQRFNPLVPFLNIFMNNRDHRKITVIDGRIGYTGGYNLANEYFHLTEPFGYWKDTGVRLEGDAVRTLTVICMEMWGLMSDHVNLENGNRFFSVPACHARESGFVQPYADSPLDEEPTGEEVYMNMLRNAEHYAWFVTPYLLITDELRREFVAAAKRGVDVRIITPGIPDKKMVYQETRSYYAGLVRGGVRIFEYTPGFCHAKMSVSDDVSATVGTINLDYRSLYLHFENGILFHHCQIVGEIRQDFEKMFSESAEVTDHYRKGAQNHFQRTGRALFRFIAPLL